MILSLDQGTTSSRAILFDRDGRPKAIAQKEFTQHFPKPGWVEHDPHEIWASQVGVAAEALGRAGIAPAQVHAVGITNQRETVVMWDRRSGEPIANAIVWQDRRTADVCGRLKADGVEPEVQRRTGLVIDPYFSATKIAWLLEHTPGARTLAGAGHLAFGTVDSWLVWRLTGGTCHITDASNASRTLLFNIHSGDWDDELLRIFGVPRSVLPSVRASSESYGVCAASTGLGSIPIGSVIGDQQAALFGQLCTKPGLAKNTYGTGCFLLQHIGATPKSSTHRLLTTVAWRIGSRLEYALEGSVFIGGAVVQWVRDGLRFIRSAPEIEALAATVPDNGGVYLVPAFAGLGAPYWDAHARGAIVGLTRGSTAAHIARAALESIAFQVADLLDAVEADADLALDELRVDGGAAQNDLLLQLQVDLLGVPVVRPRVTETTALGAAYLAGLATGFWPSTAALEHQWQVERRFEPRMETAEVERLRSGWRDAIARVRSG